MSHAVGPYEFSLTDARRTVAEAVEMLDDVAPQHRAAVADRRDRVRALVGEVDASRAPEATVVDLLDRVWPELLGVHDDLVVAGVTPAPQAGRVVALHLGAGGVPKASVDEVTVRHGGVVGDRQATRRHHGAPHQALCLWADEVIAGLAADGHPIGPGSAGENVTVAGLDWSVVTPGVVLAVGGVRCLVASYAVPCRQNAGWFSDRRFDRIHHRNGPVSRVYATVVGPGTIEVGDDVALEP